MSVQDRLQKYSIKCIEKTSINLNNKLPEEKRDLIQNYTHTALVIRPNRSNYNFCLNNVVLFKR